MIFFFMTDCRISFVLEITIGKKRKIDDGTSLESWESVKKTMRKMQICFVPRRFIKKNVIFA